MSSKEHPVLEEISISISYKDDNGNTIRTEEVNWEIAHIEEESEGETKLLDIGLLRQSRIDSAITYLIEFLDLFKGKKGD